MTVKALRLRLPAAGLRMKEAFSHITTWSASTPSPPERAPSASSGSRGQPSPSCAGGRPQQRQPSADRSQVDVLLQRDPAVGISISQSSSKMQTPNRPWRSAPPACHTTPIQRRARVPPYAQTATAQNTSADADLHTQPRPGARGDRELETTSRRLHALHVESSTGPRRHLIDTVTSSTRSTDTRQPARLRTSRTSSRTSPPCPSPSRSQHNGNAIAVAVAVPQTAVAHRIKVSKSPAGSVPFPSDESTNTFDREPHQIQSSHSEKTQQSASVASTGEMKSVSSRQDPLPTKNEDRK